MITFTPIRADVLGLSRSNGALLLSLVGVVRCVLHVICFVFALGVHICRDSANIMFKWATTCVRQETRGYFSLQTRHNSRKRTEPTGLTFLFLIRRAFLCIFCSGLVRVLAGWVGDRPRVVRNLMAGSAAAYCGALTVLSLAFSTFPSLLAFCLLYGLGGGKWTSSTQQET